MRRDGGGADVDGNAARLIEKTRPDAGNKLFLIHRHRDTAVFKSQCGLQGMQLRVSQREPGHTPLAFHGLKQKLHFTARIFEAGLFNLHVIEPGGGIEPDIPGFHLLAHDLPVHLTLCRDINHRVIKQGGVAAKAAACF